MTAMHAGQNRIGAIAGAVLADVMVILTALFFGMSAVAWIKWTWFIVSCTAFMGIFYVIWVSQMQANALERDDLRTNHRRNASILTVLWLIYPVILAVAPDGLNYIGDTLSVLLIAIVLALPLTGLTLLIGAALWPFYTGALLHRLLCLTLQGLAALTLPHMLLDVWLTRRWTLSPAAG